MQTYPKYKLNPTVQGQNQPPGYLHTQNQSGRALEALVQAERGA